jgi:phosphoribosyl 1,2-cyclic phosphodiesterase
MVGVRVRSLASGSDGNALLIDAGSTRLLLDAGLPARRLEQALQATGVAPASLSAVLLSHEHTDHSQGLASLARRHALPVYLTAGTARHCAGLAGLRLELIEPAGGFQIGQTTITTIPLRHDAAEPCGFCVSGDGWTITLLTDFGAPDAHLIAPIAAADLVVIEANHDLDRLWSGPYSWPLKRRIASPTGHLCNDDCGALLAAALTDHRQRTVWLAHLSAENNEAGLALATVGRQLADRPVTLAVLPPLTGGPPWPP